MYQDIPQLKRCCICFPLRHSLLVWSYLKLITSLFLLYLVIVYSIFSMPSDDDVLMIAWAFMWPFVLILVIMKIAFNIIFIISVHEKKLYLLKAYYNYSIIVVIMLVFLTILKIGFDIFDSNPFITVYIIAQRLSTFILIIVIKLYVILLLRSEIEKLEGQSKVELFEVTPTAPPCPINAYEDTITFEETLSENILYDEGLDHKVYPKLTELHLSMHNNV